MRKFLEHKKALIIMVGVFILIIVGLIIGILIVRNNKSEKNEIEMSLEEYYDEYFKEVDEIYDNNPDNIEKVISYFTKEANNSEGVVSAGNVAMSEIMWFNRNDEDDAEALLRGLVQIDYSELANNEKLFYYGIILGTAKEIGNDSIVEKYTQMKDDAARGYLAELEIFKQDLENDLNGGGEELSEGAIREKQEQYDEVVREIKEYKELYD